MEVGVFGLPGRDLIEGQRLDDSTEETYELRFDAEDGNKSINDFTLYLLFLRKSWIICRTISKISLAKLKFN